MPQLWQGRASKAVDSRVNDFNSSIRFDARMIEQDIQGSMVHSAMLGRQGIISAQDVEDIHKGLQGILEDLHSGALEIDPAAEDVHTFVEQTLTARVGDAGKRLHTGRSRNDQVALDLRLNLREASRHLQGQIKELIETLCAQAEKSAGYVMPGYTHLQRAQPVTFGHQLMAYAWMLLRDLGRLQDATGRMDAECPLVPARWRAPPTRWTGFIRPRNWALTPPALTPSTACPTGISASSCARPSPPA